MRIHLSFQKSRTLPLSDILTGDIQEFAVLSKDNFQIMLQINHETEEVFKTPISLTGQRCVLPIEYIERWTSIQIDVLDKPREAHEPPYQLILEIVPANEPKSRVERMAT